MFSRAAFFFFFYIIKNLCQLSHKYKIFIECIILLFPLTIPILLIYHAQISTVNKIVLYLILQHSCRALFKSNTINAPFPAKVHSIHGAPLQRKVA